MNKFLFGIIGVLGIAIIGVGAFTLYGGTNSQSAATVAGATPTETIPVATPDTSGVAASTSVVATPAATPAPAQTTTQTPTQAPGTYTLAQVKAHATPSSCYTAINGSVYDVTSWIKQHPGGSEAIISLCGTDGSSAFNGQHGGERRPASELASFKIGILVQ